MTDGNGITDCKSGGTWMKAYSDFAGVQSKPALFKFIYSLLKTNTMFRIIGTWADAFGWYRDYIIRSTPLL